MTPAALPLDKAMLIFNRKQIQQTAREVLESSPGGIRWSELLAAIHTASPETPLNSIQGGTLALLQRSPDIIKVARGTYQLVKYSDEQSLLSNNQDAAVADEPLLVTTPEQKTVTLLESDFYASFADWLVESAEEVNVAIALGGSVLKGKWGTPDVLGC